jgi:hypothetical protein
MRPSIPVRWLVALLLVGGACSSESEEPGSDSSAAVTRLPKRCRGADRAPPAADVTFTTGGRLYAATADGRKLRCLVEDVEAERIAWGGEADRVLLDGDSTRLFTPDVGGLLSSDQQQTSWSRPTGTSLISVSPEGQLLKSSAGEDETADISFLVRHDEAVYHPAGTHIATVGEDADGTYGLFISNNEGRDDQLVAVGESARRIYNLAFDHEGDTLYYAAEHKDRFDLHSLRVTAEEVGDEGTVASRLGTLFSGPDEVTNVLVSEFSSEPLIAFQTHCRVRVVSGGADSPVEGDLGDANAEPVGWLSDGTLLVLAYDNGCAGSGRLFAVDSERSMLVAESVDAAAPRVVLPPPPEPPDVDTEVVA